MIEWIIIIFVCIIVYYTGFFDDLFSNTPNTDSDSGSNSTPDSDNTDEKPKLGSRLIGVKTDNTIHIKENINAPWVPIQRVGKATGSTNGLGLTNADTLVDETIKAKSVIQLNSGMLLALTTNNELYTKDSLTSNIWNKVKTTAGVNNIALRSVIQLKNGMIVGISRDNKMYTKNSLISPWVFLANTDCVSLSQLSDGTLIGIRLVGGDNGQLKLFTKNSLTGLWNELQNNDFRNIGTNWYDEVRNLFSRTDRYRVSIDLTVIPGALFNVFAKADSGYSTAGATYVSDAIVFPTGRTIPYRRKTTESLEEPLPAMSQFPNPYIWNTYRKISYTVESGKVRYVLIDYTGKLFVSNLFVPTGNNFYQPGKIMISELDGSESDKCCFEDIHQLNDGTILGVNYDSGFLYTRQNWTSEWILVGSTEIDINQISALPNGKIIGISNDNKLYFRSSLNSPWERENNIINIIYSSILISGYRLGIFTDYNAYTSKDGKTWTKVANTTGIKAACQMSDKQIIAIGASDGKIKIKEILESEEPWKNLDDACCWISIQNLQ